MSQYSIAVLAGDGIGPEVMQEANKVLDAVEKKFNVSLNRTAYPVGGHAIDTEGEARLPKTLLGPDQADEIFLGSIGGPKWDT